MRQRGEIKHNIQTGTTEFVTYIGGDGYTAPIVLKSDGTTQNYLYLQRDYQGSIVAISNASGQVLEKRLFDAWGNVLVQDRTGNTLNDLSLLDRGYTGHEHLQSVGLIHMNGRLYDSKLHRFLQPDNYVQDLANTQNYNRYGYVLNNPLKYIDPSGEKSTPNCDTCGGSNFDNTQYGSGIAQSIKSFFEDPKNKEWLSKNMSARTIKVGWDFVGGNLESAAKDIGNGFRSVGRAIGKTWNKIFGGKKRSGPPPNMGTNVNMNAYTSGVSNNSFHPRQLLPNFKSDIGFDIFKFKGLHYGVPEFETNLLNGRGAITPGPLVIYPTGGSSMETYNTHEGGHFVQFLALKGAYYPLIAIPSIINTQLNWKIFDYTEKTANDLWYWWSGESSNMNRGYIKR